jgi:hypothetical protein
VCASIKLDDLYAASSALQDEAQGTLRCCAISAAWISEAAVALVLKREKSGETSRRLFVFSCTGYGSEVVIDDDDLCHVSPELDGCVAVGEKCWSLIRDVPLAVLRVCCRPWCKVMSHETMTQPREVEF